MKEEKFSLDIWDKFSIARVVRHWKKLPRKTVDASSLAILKASLDGALSGKHPCPQKEDWKQMVSRSLPN